MMAFSIFNKINNFGYLIINDDKNYFISYENGKITKIIESKKDVKQLLKNYTYPLLILLDKYPLTLHHINYPKQSFFKKIFLLKQAKLNVFESPNWINSICTFNANQHRTIFIQVNPSEHLNYIINFLKNKKHPIVGVHIAPIAIAQSITAWLKNSNSWTIAFIPSKNHIWEMIVCHHSSLP